MWPAPEAGQVADGGHQAALLRQLVVDLGHSKARRFGAGEGATVEDGSGQGRSARLVARIRGWLWWRKAAMW